MLPFHCFVQLKQKPSTLKEVASTLQDIGIDIGVQESK
jgi:hypothetical protein